jgi:pimeloyl-ACP methyl ester carboxylesterase
VFGTADPTGTVDLTKRAVELLPRAELALVDDAGHMIWFDDPSQVSAATSAASWRDSTC